ncbi:MAG: hypothetical protein PHI90_01045 [Clostridia bacterium]|nr:hypothetical protein [Clostridia bacterium]MDD4047410.1 hypothetical protein [Clostridia bacterium]
MVQQNVTKIRTSTLLHRLFKSPNLKEFIEKNTEAIHLPLFHIYISELCQVMGQVPERIIKQSAIERTYGHQLFNGTRKPSRDKVIQLAYGFGLDVDGTQKLLKMAQKNFLYPRLKRDAAILYCIKHHIGFVETQGILHDLQLTLLGGGEKND